MKLDFAKELYFRSPRLDAEAALEMGLVNEVLDDDDFGQAAVHWCMDVASKAPIALSRMKENINLAAAVDLATALDNEAVNMAFTMSTEDHKEAAAAFVEKRAPVFVVATANDVAALPPELLRRGRFDELFFVDLPTEAERVESSSRPSSPK